jgi:hypothetical protein
MLTRVRARSGSAAHTAQQAPSYRWGVPYLLLAQRFVTVTPWPRPNDASDYPLVSETNGLVRSCAACAEGAAGGRFGGVAGRRSAHVRQQGFGEKSGREWEWKQHAAEEPGGTAGFLSPAFAPATI